MTNKTALDERYVKLLKKDWQPADDLFRYSVTKLLSNVRESVILERFPPTDEDASDSFQAFIGTCVHEWLESHVDGGENEVKLEAKIDDRHTVVGVIDRIEGDKIIDYKVKKSSDKDVETAMKQIKIYAYLARKNGIFIESGEVHVFRKDWSKMRTPDKPPIEVFSFSIDSSDIEWAKEFCLSKIEEFEKARESLPECTDEDKWKEPDKWAVYSKFNTDKAKKLFDSEEEARAFGGIVEHRPGRYVKCDNFCKVRKLCKRYEESDLK